MHTTSLTRSRQRRKPSTSFVLLLGAALAAWPAFTPAAFAQHKKQDQDLARALTPTAFIYQGQLKDGGVPASGSFDFEFTLYTAQTGGDELNSIIYEDIILTDGLFRVPLDFDRAAIDGQESWLEVAVRPSGSVEPYTVLSPRQRLTSTPYAIFAQQERWSLIGVPVGFAGGENKDAIVTDKMADQAVTDAKNVSEQSVKSIDSLKDQVTPDIESHTALAPNGTPGRIVKFDSSGNPTANSIMFDTGARVGVGTTSPAARLHALSGGFTPQLQLTQTVTGDPQGQSFARLRFDVRNSSFWDIAVGEATNNVMNFFRQGTGNIMTLRSNGTVGIGTTTPSTETTLHVRAAQDNFGVLVDSLGQASSRIGLHAGSAGFSSLARTRSSAAATGSSSIRPPGPTSRRSSQAATWPSVCVRPSAPSPAPSPGPTP